ncbi:MAG: C-terminal helicase domain-containing protein [Mariprofundaceae bacterium]|nr:C-terminal helicase domain-containing protein [Mariprofundaceae bacterium]
MGEEGVTVPDSAKLGMLREMLVEMIEEGRRILLFSQFTGMLKLIEEELKILDIDYVTLTGKTKDRETPVRRFQNNEVPLFLISLKAGGVGLNLTAADTVIHYDPWWNPAAENQATDRAHRIGQDKSVFVYKLITEGTVEEKILELQDRKRELAEGIYQKGAARKQLWTPDDMDALFAPLK